MKKLWNELSPEMIDCLQGKNIVMLSVLEKVNQKVFTTALSWVFAINKNTIRFAIDSKSDFLNFIEENPRINMVFMGAESVYLVTGKAYIKHRDTDDLTLKLALLECDIEDIRDIMFYGGKLVTQPTFIKTYNEKLVNKLDSEVMTALTNL